MKNRMLEHGLNRSEPAESAQAICDYLKGVETRARSYPNTIRTALHTGDRATVVDADGREFIDALSGAGALLSGHNHPAIISAIKAFLDSKHVFQALDVATPTKAEFTRALLACFPEPFRRDARILFCGPTGADAVEAAVKLFKTYTRRPTVVAFHGAYHGMTHGALSLTGNLAAKEPIGGLMPGVNFLPYPYTYRCPFGVGGDRSAELCMNYVRNALTDTSSGIPRPAAVIVEAVQGEGGCIPADVRWLRGLRELTRELEIPLIVDEVQTGMARTGNMFAFEAAEITPDAVVLSKAIGGGLPLSVVVFDKRYDIWNPGAHAGTFRGNQMAMAAGIATIELIHSEGLVAESRRKGEKLMVALRRLAERFPVIGDVRGRGLMVGLEIVDPQGPRGPAGDRPAAPAMCRAIIDAAFDCGLIIEAGGRQSAVVRLLPPLVITDEQLERIVSILETSILRASAKLNGGAVRVAD